jgi:hypothetical protein
MKPSRNTTAAVEILPQPITERNVRLFVREGSLSNILIPSLFYTALSAGIS